jgi:hypothetical protein
MSSLGKKPKQRKRSKGNSERMNLNFAKSQVFTVSNYIYAVTTLGCILQFIFPIYTLFIFLLLPSHYECPVQMLPHPEAALWDSALAPLQWQLSVSGLQTTVCPLSPVLFHIPVIRIEETTYTGDCCCMGFMCGLTYLGFYFNIV